MRRSTWIAVLATVAVLAAAGWFSRVAPLPGAPQRGASTATPAAAVPGAGFDWEALATRATELAWSAQAAADQAWRVVRAETPGVLAGADLALQRVPTWAAMAAVLVGILMLAALAVRARDRRRTAVSLLRRGLHPARVAQRTRIPRDALRAMARARRR